MYANPARSEKRRGKVPWNKGKIVGPKPPFRLKEVWAIRIRLQLDQRIRDLALFNLVIDSKLRGCDLDALKVGDIPHGGYRGSPRSDRPA